MTLSVMDITGGIVSSARSIAWPAVAGVLMNYPVLTTVIPCPAYVLIRDKAFFTGFVIVATVPPALLQHPSRCFSKAMSASPSRATWVAILPVWC